MKVPGACAKKCLTYNKKIVLQKEEFALQTTLNNFHTFEFFHAESHSWHYVMIFFLIWFKMVEYCGLARIVKTQNKNTAFFFLKTKKVD